MQRTDFDYDLPPQLIAQRPLAQRSASRLLTLNRQSGAVTDRLFADLPQLLRPGDLLVFNNTKVIPARLLATKPSGGQVEILIERLLDDGCALALVRSNKPLRVGMQLHLSGQPALVFTGREGEFFRLCPIAADLTDLLNHHGHTPLPPYIQRAAEPLDQDRYQTVFAQCAGSVAAPTAGLHFDAPLLAQLQACGIERAEVTLHVGAGTFQPVRVDNLDDHRMHAEWLQVTAEVCEQIVATKARAGRVIAVGTTSVRSLETAASSGQLQPFCGDSRLFIRPGDPFRVVDALITNFHLPQSTLLMLVSAFAGHAAVMAAYRHAVAQQYRFFSYGDAMLVS